MNQDHHDRGQLEEHKRSPMINLSDSVTRSQYGNFEELTKGGC